MTTEKTFNISEMLSRNWSSDIDLYPMISISSANKIEQYRWESLLDKEPETIEWISNMSESSTLLDVGANVGVYTIAALARRVRRVICIEPSPLNFSRLVHNLHSNNLFTSSLTFCIGLSSEFRSLYFSHPQGLDYGLAEFSVDLCQQSTTSLPIVLCPLDMLIDQSTISEITHLKIDVDGSEIDVLRGCSSLLTSPSLISILVEVGLGEIEECVRSKLELYGFVEDEYFSNLKNHSTTRRQIEKIPVKNIVFKRQVHRL